MQAAQSEPAVSCRGLRKIYDARRSWLGGGGAAVVAVDGLDLADRGAASASACSDRTARARPRPSRSWRASWSRPRARSSCWGCRGRATRCACASASASRLQETRLPERLSVREVLDLFRSFYRRSRPVAALLADVELTEKRDAWVGKLSGGPAPAAGDRLRAGRRAGDPVPRRADHRARSAVAPPALGSGAAVPRRGRHGRADHALHGGGRAAVRPRGHHRPRPHHQGGIAGRADPRPGRPARDRVRRSRAAARRCRGERPAGAAGGDGRAPVRPTARAR